MFKQKLINVCDRCGLQCTFAEMYIPTTETGGFEDVETLDLCITCTRSLLLKMVVSMPLEERLAWLQHAREKLAPARI